MVIKVSPVDSRNEAMSPPTVQSMIMIKGKMSNFMK